MGAEANGAMEERQEETTIEAVESLLEAARYNDMEDLLSLVSNGVSVNSKDSQGRTALHMASANGHQEIIEFLISNGAGVNDLNEEKNTPLHYACLNGHVEVVKRLIHAGANVSSLNSHEKTPVDEAVIRGKMEVVNAISETMAVLELAATTVD